MPTRSRRTWKPDPRGYYSRQIGWVLSKSGTRQQHKFILGTDRKKAESCEQRLRELWEMFESSSEVQRPLWPQDLLAIAKQVAKGKTHVTIVRYADEQPADYATRLRFLQTKCLVALLEPEDQETYKTGVDQIEQGMNQARQVASMIRSIDFASLDLKHATDLMKAYSSDYAKDEGIERLRRAHATGPSQPEAATPARGEKRTQTPTHTTKGANSDPRERAAGATLHQAFDAYAAYVRREYHDPETRQISAWGNTQLKQVKALKERHENITLDELDATAVDDMIGYWRRRPYRQKSEKPMTRKSCNNHLSTLTRFLKWLNSTSQYNWTLPISLIDTDTKVRPLSGDRARKSIAQVETFTLDELRLLMRYGQPLDRLLLLLGLNCGFGNAEVASLLVGEVCLFQAHTNQDRELLRYPTTDEDSFIKRIRRKSGVYGEHILFPMTVKGIEWVFERRRRFPNFSRETRLIVNENGKPFDTPTKNGNRNQGIPNRFARLITRIKDDENEIRGLSFNKLRKTAGNLIRLHSDGEIMGVFHCRGTPVKTDDLSEIYSNRPFGRVFQAIRDVQQYLTPVFREAGRAPFAPQAQAYTKRSAIDRIIELHKAGCFPAHIASEVRLSTEAVSRHIRRYEEQNRADAAGSPIAATQ